MTAALLIDFQIDFLDHAKGRMPVRRIDAERVIALANSVLSGGVLSGSLVLAIVNAFPRNQWFANFVRRNSAIAGSTGAQFDPRLKIPPTLPVIPKEHGSAFTNPKLGEKLEAHGVRRLVLLGVMTEGCIRATAADARRLGYEVVVPMNAVATDNKIKSVVGKFLMRRAGVLLPEKLEPWDP